MRNPPDPREAQAIALRDEIAKRLATNVRRLRATRRWSQEEAAWNTQIGVRFFQRVEGADEINATLETLARLAVGFGVEVAELITAAPHPTKRRSGRPTKASSASTKARRSPKKSED